MAVDQKARSTGCFDKDGNELFLGDHVRYRLEGSHTKREYWNPEYEIVFEPPSFGLKHIGGGKDGGSHAFKLRAGGGNGSLELIKRATPAPATPVQPSTASVEGVPTEAMIRAACKAFYKTDNIDGVSLSFRGADHTFRSAFTRMWKAAAAASLTPAPTPVSEPADEPTKREKEAAWTAFHQWWDREQACPEHSLTTQNAAHAAWQEAYRLYRAKPPEPAGGDAIREALADLIAILSDDTRRYVIEAVALARDAMSGFVPSTQEARLRLDLQAAECLHVSAYKAGLQAGWNFAKADDETGFQAATASTEHVAELKRISLERAALSAPASPPAGVQTDPAVEGGRAWLVKGWLPNGDGCEFTFADEAEYRRFVAEKPAHFDVSDIEEMIVSGCDQALEALAHPASANAATEKEGGQFECASASVRPEPMTGEPFHDGSIPPLPHRE